MLGRLISPNFIGKIVEAFRKIEITKDELLVVKKSGELRSAFKNLCQD